MQRSGCRYISISPESGSKNVMKSINKPFNLKHANRIIKRMNDKNIFSQACFVLGYIDETKKVIVKHLGKDNSTPELASAAV